MEGVKHNDVGLEFTFSNCRSPVQDAPPPPRAQIACSSSVEFVGQLCIIERIQLIMHNRGGGGNHFLDYPATYFE